MKFCIGCEEKKEEDFFYRKQDSRCKDCTNKYQRDRRRRMKEEKGSEDLIIKLFDKMFEEKISSSNKDILDMLEEIMDRMDQLNDKLNKLSTKRR